MFLIDVTDVKPLPQRQLALTFADGVQGIVFLDEIAPKYQGVFAPLLDNDFFQKVTLDKELGTVVWPNGADLCPDVLYSCATGRPLVVTGESLISQPCSASPA
ncbi:DUF2442 domain-containing protein [Rhabdochromatium marinum]|uniref:DUF2442 domain-containing protein n=1 Tax=Rhabdochromatium marinum TaxID=48729 RepID=UPI001906F5D7|nr:DUF2442 domain-containing protein [Rhabdochromatium marinum]MBK1647774.1 hypothetical protein [Rhabdochromatium marinum]